MCIKISLQGEGGVRSYWLLFPKEDLIFRKDAEKVINNPITF